MKYLSFLVGVLITITTFFTYQYFNTYNVGSEMTGSTWFLNASQQIQAGLSVWGLKIPSLSSSGDCLVTNATGVVSTAPCGSGGTGSNWDVVSGGLETATTTDFAKASYFVATGTTATSTFAGGIDVGANHIIAHGIQSDASDGLHVHAGNGTNVALFGAGNTANALFYGGVNIDGATRLATSINGVLQATAGAVTATTTGTLTENVTGLEFDATRALIGGSAILSLTSGYAIPTTTDFTNWNTAYASTTALTPSYIRGLFSNTATGLTYTGATGITALTAGYNIPLSASTTNWNGFYDTPSTRITAGTGLSWAGNTLSATGGTGSNWTIESGGLRTSTTTDFAKASYFIATSTTASSTFAGNVGIGTTTPTTPLSVVGDSLVTATSTVQSKLFVGTRGTNTTFGPWSGGTGFGNFVSSCDGCGATGGNLLAIANFGGGTAGINTFSARGTTASPTATQSGDDIYFMGGRGHGSTTWANGSKVAINMEASQTWTDSAQGTQLSLETTPNNSTTRAVRVQVTNDGNVGISTTTPVGKLTVVGTSGGSILQLLSDTGTKFMELLNTGVLTLLGAIDAGGATSFEIPNGTAPTVDTTGEITLDTTGDQFLVADSGGTARVVQIEDQLIWSRTIASTSIAFINGSTMPLTTRLDGFTITRIQCHVTSGTSKVIAIEDASGNSSEDITCGTTNTTDDGSITNSTYTASELGFIDFGATSGAVDYVSISVFGNWTRE